MEKIKTVYLENIFIKWKEVSSKQYMISFYIEIDEVDKEIQIQIVNDYEYNTLYQNYGEVFSIHKWYKQCEELHDLIAKHVNWIDELPWYSIFSIHLYEPVKTIYTWY